jgi:hypothetical protein
MLEKMRITVAAHRVEIRLSHAKIAAALERGEGVVTLLKIGRSIVGIRGNSHAAATTSRHGCMAEALKARCVLADVGWRWTLKALGGCVG